MAIDYCVKTLKNSWGEGIDRKFVSLLMQPSMSVQKLENTIEANCTLTKSDVSAALVAIREQAIEALSSGHEFHLPGLGTFSLQVKVRDDRKDDIDKVTGNDLSIRNVVFRPEKSLLTEVQKQVRFNRVKNRSESMVYTEDELKSKIDAYLSEKGFLSTKVMLQEFGIRRSLARKWLNYLVTTGFLRREVNGNAFLYFRGKTVTTE